jgi:hypothetical protein
MSVLSNCENVSKFIYFKPLISTVYRESDSRWALEVSKVPALNAEFEKTLGRPRLLSPSGGTPVLMTRVRDDIRVAYPNFKSVGDRWSSSEHPALSVLQFSDCPLCGVIVLVSDKVYLLEENKKDIVQQFDLQHMWLTKKNDLNWIIMTPNLSVSIKFATLNDAAIISLIVQATKELLGSSMHLNSMQTQVASLTRSVFQTENGLCPYPPLIQNPLVNEISLKINSEAVPRTTEKDLTPRKWWEAFFAPNRFVVFLYTMGVSMGDVYIGNMTCGVRSGWGVFICHSLQRVYSGFWRHDRPYGFYRVTECSAAGSDVYFCGFTEGGQFGPGVPGGLQPPTLGYLVRKVPLHMPECCEVLNFLSAPSSDFRDVFQLLG